MENKNNYTVKQLVDKLKELCETREYKDSTYKWAYTVGTLEAILDWEVKGFNKGFKTLQETINEAFLRCDEELQGLKELVAA
jgi:hypothetical protein